MGQQIIDDKFAPLYYVRLQGQMELAHMQAQADYFDRLLSERKPYLVISDYLAATGTTSPRLGQFWLAWIRKNKARFPGVCLGAVNAIDSPLLRVVARTTIALIRPPYPTSICSSLADCLTWTQEQAAKNALPILNPDPQYWARPS